MTSVLIAYPHSEKVAAAFHHSLFRLMQSDDEIEKSVAPMQSGPSITMARNELVRIFLRDSTAEWLWWVDTDMVFELDVLGRLVASAGPVERPVMGALCFAYLNGVVKPTMFMLRGDGKTEQFLQLPAIDGIYRVLTGTGCLLVHRSVFERMRLHYQPPFEWFQQTSAGCQALGEDITFAKRCEHLGIPVHVDTRIECGHEKSVVIDRHLFGLLKGDKATSADIGFFAPAWMPDPF